MKIPLITKLVITSDGKQYIEVWINSRKQLVPAPFNPYFLSTYSMKIPVDDHTSDTIIRKPISTLRETQLIKYTFP